MKIKAIKSSKINIVGYDERSRKLRVSFIDEQPQEFCHVPEDVFTAFINARSKNRFFKRHIKDEFPC
jgi:hypothetical protein